MKRKNKNKEMLKMLKLVGDILDYCDLIFENPYTLPQKACD